MRMRRILTPFRLLCWAAGIFACILIFMVYDDMGGSERQELLATQRLLETYKYQLQEMKSKLKETEGLLVQQTSQSKWEHGLPVIYLITPTHTRLEQKAELTRLSQTLMHVKNIHWIVIEDSAHKTDMVIRFLSQLNFNYTHLSVATPSEFKLHAKDPNWLKPRGVLQRNAGLSWLRAHTSPLKHSGVVYFADDDNTYSLKLFDEMRFTKVVSVWPVALVGYLRYESPLVKNGKVVGWFTYWRPSRPFPMDMAGFAINLKLVHKFSQAQFSNDVERGYQESTLLTGMNILLEDLEPKANLCTQILVWHTRTEKSSIKNEERMFKKYGHGSDLDIEV